MLHTVPVRLQVNCATAPSVKLDREHRRSPAQRRLNTKLAKSKRCWPRPELASNFPRIEFGWKARWGWGWVCIAFAFACGWSANCQNVSTIFKLTASGCNGSSSSELNRQTDTGAFRSRKTVAINCIKVLTRQQPPPPSPTLLALPPSGGKNNGELLCKLCNNKNNKHESYTRVCLTTVYPPPSCPNTML